MTVALGTVQFADNQTGAPASITITGLNIGDYIMVGGTVSTAAAHTLSVSDDKGETYTAPDGLITDTGNLQQIRAWYAPVTVAGTHVVTLGVTNPGAGTFAGVWAGPVTGASAVAAHGPGNQQTSPGTGTDAVTSGTAQVPSGTPCLVVAFSQDVSTGVAAPAAGTGFTSAGTGWGFGGAAGANVESKRITSGNAQGTFTTSGGVSTITQMVAFLEAGVGGALITRKLLLGVGA